MTQRIPTFRPALPDAAALMPLLREIDANRWYSNFGPLARRFEAALAHHFDVEPHCVVTVCNATLGIAIALEEAGGRGGLCMMPAWTHIASASGAIGAGLTPWFVDVDSRTWQLEPAAAKALIAAAPQRPSVVLAVSPFGAPVDSGAWEAFTAETGVPAVIDAAAAFDTVRAARATAQVVSLHATKAMGIGEGGFIIVADAARANRLRRMTNFGLNPERVSLWTGTNAKLTEFAAAIGLAALAQWPKRRAEFRARAHHYAVAMARIPGIAPAPCFDGSIATSTANFILPDPVVGTVIAHMNRQGIEARKWWPVGCHDHPSCAGFPSAPLPVTERLADRVIGLPFYPDITDAEIGAVVDTLAVSLRAC